MRGMARDHPESLTSDLGDDTELYLVRLAGELWPDDDEYAEGEL
jgi:hypothetical protein